MTVSLEVRSLSKLFFFPPLFSVSLLLFLGVPASLSLFLSRSSPQRAPDWRVVQGWKATAEGNPKANNTKIYMRGRERHCCTHTHTRRSPEDYHQRDTGHFREDSICSLPYLIPQKEHCVLRKLLIFTFTRHRAKYSDANIYNLLQTTHLYCPGGYRKSPGA